MTLQWKDHCGVWARFAADRLRSLIANYRRNPLIVWSHIDEGDYGRTTVGETLRLGGET